jgi:hypothetical protein
MIVGVFGVLIVISPNRGFKLFLHGFGEYTVSRPVRTWVEGLEV